MIIKNIRSYGLILSMVVSSGLLFAPKIQTQTLPSETPKELKPTNDGFEYTRRDVMIPMRDGVKLHTVIIVPKKLAPSADTADAHALQRYRVNQSRQQLASRDRS